MSEEDVRNTEEEYMLGTFTPEFLDNACKIIMFSEETLPTFLCCRTIRATCDVCRACR